MLMSRFLNRNVAMEISSLCECEERKKRRSAAGQDMPQLNMLPHCRAFSEAL